MSNDKLDWNADLINSIFDLDTSNHILNIPILNPHREDKCIWNWNPSGSYTVRSAYKGYLQHSLCLGHLCTPGPWETIWNLCISHKIKHFIWRLMRDILPTRPNLQKKGISCPSTCFRCDIDIENTWHTFFSCPSAKLCWQGSKFHYRIMKLINSSDGVFNLISHILQCWAPQDVTEFSMILWSMWHSRNALHWNNTPWNQNEIILRASSMLHDWATANRAIPAQHSKPPPRQRWSPPSHGKSFAFLHAINWTHNQNLENIIFEKDCKRIPPYFSNHHSADTSEFGCLLDQCKPFMANPPNSHVSFSPRSANIVAHKLAKAAIDSANHSDFFHILNCIFYDILNDMN
uniref:Reverse transcriptase zinc-binding domain-containing protein n=1 Tax=Cajanus cajan TaxID=3821 RepID=A0A151S0G9_CAJCA|nr:hypothetical protein KK1_030017 [Cajanus cajan]